MPTLEDILKELAKPGRDPRKEFENVRFADGVETIEDLVQGMRLAGVGTNVTAFGAFVDIGVHQDGLVHISQLADRFVKDPNDVVKVTQRVEVTVLDVDLARNRISLSMKENPEPPEKGNSRGPGKHGKKEARPKPKKQVPGPFNNPFAKVLGKR